MRLRSILAFIAFLLLFVACTVPPPPEAEKLGQTSQELIPQGQRCLENAQCKTGFCVDTVCCNTACGFGARDTLSCSNIYGTRLVGGTSVPNSSDGTCMQLDETSPCGALTSFNPCEWKGGVVNHGGQCNAPDGTLEVACQACNTSSDCPAGLPVCVNGGCTSCTGDFGSGAQNACPTAAAPACVDSACVQCSATNTTACTGNKGSCDVDQNLCVGCTGDFGSASKFPCTAALPACLGTGACAQCSGTVACSNDRTPGKTICDSNVCVNCVDSSTCPATAPVCTNKQCVACNGDHGSGATSACPTTTEPACVSGSCLECSATDATACANIPGKPVCDTTDHKCVECNAATQAADCTDPLKPFCNNHVCTAQCTDSSQCSAPTPVCKSGFCVACTDDATCLANSPATPICDASNNCVECRSAANCTKDATKPVCSSTGSCVGCDGDNGSASPNACPSTTFPACNIDTGMCVTCNANNKIRCTGTTAICDTSSFTCVQCLNSGNCVETSSTPVCNTSTHTCTGCNADNLTPGSPPTVLACPGALLPACVSGSCFECKADASGINTSACTPGEPVCFDGAHDCVQCTQNSDCNGTNGICDLGSHLCAPGCATDANCADPTPRCKVTASTCVQCLDFTDCKDPTKPTCNVTTNRCVGCVNDAQCPTTKPFCDGSACHACNGDFASGATFACKDSTMPACRPDGSCGLCSATNTNKCAAPTSACDPATGTCVECSSNAQCSGSKPICDTTQHKCVACNGDLGSAATAACFTATAPACALDGIHQGQCVQCRTTNVTACTSALPVCDAVNDICVECNSDPDCKGANGKCDVANHKCTTGCTTNQNCSSAAPVCNNGICVECSATDTSHCVAPKDKCDTTTNSCVGCTTSTDCPDTAPICSSVTHTCTTDCTKSSECPGSTPICNPGTGKCVTCVDDANCSSPTPRCDLNSGTCVPNEDGGAPDAGPTDAGTDAGKPDAGPSDAGPNDAGSSGVIDAGHPVADSGPGIIVAGPCQADSDCPTGDRCNADTKTCVKDLFAVEGGGCSCRTEAPRGIDAGALLGFGFLGALTWRRRRNRQGADR